MPVTIIKAHADEMTPVGEVSMIGNQMSLLHSANLKLWSLLFVSAFTFNCAKCFIDEWDSGNAIIEIYV